MDKFRSFARPGRWRCRDQGERELEHGRTEWQYRILHEGVTYEVRVDEATGGITRYETK